MIIFVVIIIIFCLNFNWELILMQIKRNLGKLLNAHITETYYHKLMNKKKHKFID